MRPPPPVSTMTASLLLRMFLPEEPPLIEVAFDKIPQAVVEGQADLGLLIHEGQITHQRMGLVKVLDLGEAWQRETGLPLPLGGNGIRRDLDLPLKRRLCRLLSESIAYGLDNRGEALSYATRYARGLEDDPVRSDRFVGMYVNHWTRDYGAVGRQAVQLLLDRGHEAGLLPHRVAAEFIESE